MEPAEAPKSSDDNIIKSTEMTCEKNDQKQSDAMSISVYEEPHLRILEFSFERSISVLSVP